MSDVEVQKPAFNRYVLGNAPVEKLASGFRWVEGPVWFGDGVHCVSPSGELLGKILIPETVSNVCSGGRPDAKNRLFICASTSVYSVILNRSGVQRP